MLATSGGSLRAFLRSDEASIRRLATALEELISDDMAVSFYESPPDWTLELTIASPADETAVRELTANIGGDELALSLTFERIETEDWVAKSLAGLSPVRAGRFIVHGAHSRAAVSTNRIAIEIEAALAFGTGHHGTTRGCLLLFDAWLKQERGRGHRLHILDVGTGTGILAIAAARALHADILATDIDPQAVAVARANALINRAHASIRFRVARGLTASYFRRGRYDLVFANILAGPLKQMAAEAAQVIASGGAIILSGLLPPHAAAIVSAYRMQGLRLSRRLTLDGWVTLLMRRAV